jgi:hypothetical protein
VELLQQLVLKMTQTEVNMQMTSYKISLTSREISHMTLASVLRNC